MPPDRAERVAEIVEEALERLGIERDRFVEENCGDDLDLRREIASLLGQEQTAHNFIETPVFRIDAEALASATDEAQRVGQTIGHYRILSLLGEGGMGEVYLAQDLELGRQVAIKLVRSGFATRRIVRHFRAEERILAALNHPNIARLYGGGATADGVPYFVMEYVEGEPLDVYCSKRDLSVDARLELFQKVCSAVSYAHQHLVIHRDLKPANIRVTADGEPKLLDFGIAKLLDEDAGSGASSSTLTVGPVMTPDYASPEQIRGDLVTTASDVYSLGVVLYELLTTRKPHDRGGSRPNELSRAIAEQTPPRPSAAAISPKELRGDLDNVVLKALRKEPERRYTSVAQFADDLRRYLARLPVAARKDTIAYRASRFVSRNRVLVGAAVIALLGLIIGLVISLREAENARQQRDVAQKERAKAERLNGFLQRMLSFSNQSVTSVSPVAQAKNVTVNEMLAQIMEQAKTEMSDQPEVRCEILRTIGSAYASQGQYERAEENLRAALQTQLGHKGETTAADAATLVELGVLLYRRAKLDEAAPLLERAIAFYAGKTSGADLAHLALAEDYRAVVALYQGEKEKALSLLANALRVASAPATQAHDRRVLTFVKSDFGGTLIYFGRLDEGEVLVDEAIAEYRQRPGRPAWELGASLLMKGTAQANRGHLAEAEQSLNEAERILTETLGDKNGYVCTVLNEQSVVLAKRQDFVTAERKARAGLSVAEGLAPSGSVTVAGSELNLASLLMKLARFAEAETYFRHALVFYDRSEKLAATAVRLKIQLSLCLAAQQRKPEAVNVAREALEKAEKAFGKADAGSALARKNLADISGTPPSG